MRHRRLTDTLLSPDIIGQNITLYYKDGSSLSGKVLEVDKETTTITMRAIDGTLTPVNVKSKNFLLRIKNIGLR